MPPLRTRCRTRPALLNRGFFQGSAALGGCSAGSGGRGPAIRYALPLRPPERSRAITGRPALRPFGAGAAHLAAAAPKRARRPGALRAGCLEMPAKPLPLRAAAVFFGGARVWKLARAFLHRVPVRAPDNLAVQPTFPFVPRHR